MPGSLKGIPRSLQVRVEFLKAADAGLTVGANRKRLGPSFGISCMAEDMSLESSL